MKILVADDSITNLTLITQSLQKLGHEVLAASYGQQAIEMFQVARPDLIILDVVMDGMDGFECAKRIRALGMEDWIPIIFLSASVDDASIAKGIDAGGDDYLTKPFSEITLSAKIKAMQRIAEMRNHLFEATKKLSFLSSTDALTGVYNRLQFNKTIKEKIAQADRQKNMLALLFIDLDKFKEVNDILGHHIGDLLLIEVTKRLLSCLRLDDFLARMGGDEFAVILGNIDNKKAVDIVSKKIIDNLSSPYILESNDVHCSCSVGIVFYPSDGMNQEILCKNADLAMYHAKNSGRSNFKYYNTTLKPQEDKPKNTLEKNTEKPPVSKTVTVLSCLVNTTRICMNLQNIIKNLPLPQLEPVPNSSASLVGLMNVSGRSVPVVDLTTHFQLNRSKAFTLDVPVLLCSDGGREAAFIVDAILGLYEIEKEDLQAKNYNNTNPFFLATITINSEISLLVNMQHLLATDFLRATGWADNNG